MSVDNSDNRVVSSSRTWKTFEGPAVNPTGGLPDIPAEPWMEAGICNQVDPEIFFPEKGGSTREAKRICWSCPVQEDCLEYALKQRERFGIWGGYSERERRRMERSAA